MTVLVIGGSGFIGSEVVKHLSANNVDTLSYDLVHSNLLTPKQNSIRADILEMQALQRVFFEYDIDSIIHLVGLPAIEDCQKNPHFSFLLNVMSVQNTLEAMRLADIGKIVFASSATVYGASSEKPVKETDLPSPVNVYGHHKLLAEQCILSYGSAYGIRGIILRLFNVYGGDPSVGKEVLSVFIRRALKGKQLEVRGPRKFRDFVHVGDVAEAVSRAITRENVRDLTLNIGSGCRTTLQQVASIVTARFPGVDSVESEAPDDGTGLCADVTLAKETIRFTARDPMIGIDAHVSRYCVPQVVGMVR